MIVSCGTVPCLSQSAQFRDRPSGTQMNVNDDVKTYHMVPLCE